METQVLADQQKLTFICSGQARMVRVCQGDPCCQLALMINLV